AERVKSNIQTSRTVSAISIAYGVSSLLAGGGPVAERDAGAGAPTAAPESSSGALRGVIGGIAMVDFLFLTVSEAAKYLSCSRDEIIAWVTPDRRMPGQVGPGSGARLWSQQTLDAAKPHVEA